MAEKHGENATAYEVYLIFYLKLYLKMSYLLGGEAIHQAGWDRACGCSWDPCWDWEHPGQLFFLINFLSFNSSFFLTQDDDFTFAVTGQPEWKREDFKVLYPKFRHTVSSKVLLAPTRALVVMMVYYISAATHFFRFSLSPLMQLMLQVSL